MKIEEQAQPSENEVAFQQYVEDLQLKPDDFDKVILDVGAGDASFAKWAKDHDVSSKIYSLEPIQEMIEKEKGLIGNAEDIPMPNETFELIVSNAAIPNIYLGGDNVKEKVKKSFSEMLRVLKEGGEIRLARVLMSRKYEPQRILTESVERVLNELQEKSNIKIEKIRTPTGDTYEYDENHNKKGLLAESYLIILQKTKK